MRYFDVMSCSVMWSDFILRYFEIIWHNLKYFEKFGNSLTYVDILMNFVFLGGGGAPPPRHKPFVTGPHQKWETFFRKTTFFFRSRDPSKKHGAEILCRTALVSRKIDLRRPHSWPKEFLHFCPNLGSGDEHLKWARPQTNCAQEKINAWAYPHCR